MFSIRQGFAVTISGLAMTLMAAPAVAGNYFHYSNIEQGYKVNPDHSRSDLARADVISQAADAVARGSSSKFTDNKYPASSVTHSNSALTRQAVKQQLLDESPSQRVNRLSSLSE
ncbi:hypothetical protein [Comamonas sp. C24C]